VFLWKIDYCENQQKQNAPECSPCLSHSEVNFVLRLKFEIRYFITNIKNFSIEGYFPLSYIMPDPGNFAVSGEVWVFLLSVVAGSNPNRGLDVCLLYVFCVIR